jgi:L-methionine (R)-S-oxide reductase
MSEHKKEIYNQCFEKLSGLLEGEVDEIVKMASIVSVLHQAFEVFYWTGFYRMIDGGLVIGPYQGTPACLRIAMGRGVCGTAAASGLTQIVPDVHEFTGHIACDAASNSEIVIPVRSGEEIIAVLDIDSTSLNSFDEIDAEELERILAHFFS